MYLPRIVWLSMNTKYGMNIHNLVEAAKKYETLDSSHQREKILCYIATNMIKSISSTRTSSYKSCYDNDFIFSRKCHEFSNSNSRPKLMRVKEKQKKTNTSYCKRDSEHDNSDQQNYKENCKSMLLTYFDSTYSFNKT
jgi:hypothetical protein